MVERADAIQKQIESSRNQLGSNLQELENKIKREADWRTHFERNPMMLMGAALGAGVLLASMIGTPRRDAGIRTDYTPKPNPFGGTRNQVADTWGGMKGALIGLAGAKVRSVLDEFLPGFNKQYDKMEHENPSSHSPKM